MNRSYVVKWGKRIGILLLLLAIVYIINKSSIIRELVGVVFTSFIIAYSLKPVKNSIVSKFKFNERLVSALLVVAILGTVVLTFALLIPTLFKETLDIENILNGFTELIDSVLNKLRSYNIGVVDVIYEQTSEKLNVWLIDTSYRFFDTLIALWENMISLAIIPVVTYYFLADGKTLGSKLLLVLPTEKRSVVKLIGKDIDKLLGKYIFSQLLLSLIIIVLTFIGLLVIGIKFPLWLSILNGIFNIIPYFGPIIGLVPALLIAFLTSPSKAIAVAILYFVIQQLEGDLIAPKVTGESISMHPICIILLLLIGEKLGGIFGMVLAVPIGVMVKVIYEDINYYLF